MMQCVWRGWTTFLGIFTAAIFAVTLNVAPVAAQDEGGDDGSADTAEPAEEDAKPKGKLAQRVSEIEVPGITNESGVETHDGFFLRMAIGPASFNAQGTGKENSLFKDPDVESSSISFHLDVGGAVMENFILHGEFWTEDANEAASDDLEVFDLWLRASGIGGGATYYFMPINLYATAVVSAAFVEMDVVGVTFDDENREALQDLEDNAATGVAFAGEIGKEWWVSENWGLGISFRANYFDASHDRIDWNGQTYSLLFSATYN